MLRGCENPAEGASVVEVVPALPSADWPRPAISNLRMRAGGASDPARPLEECLSVWRETNYRRNRPRLW